MQSIRNRTKDRMPNVLITVLSIVQALALELLWQRVVETPVLYAASAEAIVGWLQAFAVFSGIVLTFMIYANNVMRFRWVPTSGDLVFPFLVGVAQFVLIQNLGNGAGGWFVLVMASIFMLMTWATQASLRKARNDGDNDDFFVDRAPATWRDFVPAFGVIGGLLAFGVSLLVYPSETLAVIASVVVLLCLVERLVATMRFWNRSLSL